MGSDDVTVSRRGAFGLAFAGSAALLARPQTAEAAAVPACTEKAALDWQRGFDNQRVADLGDGRFLNPLIAGDHPDPAILKDGADYYMTFSTFDSYPGLIIWHSRDLINWRPIGPALTKNIGSVWAPELVKHKGRFYIYIPTKDPNTSWAIWADRIEGKMSKAAWAPGSTA